MSPSPLVVDSSVWIEIFASGPLAKLCEKEMKNATTIIVPTIIIFEVYRKILKGSSEDQALSVVAAMTQYKVEELSQEVALLAGDISKDNNLGTADSLVLAHARNSQAILITLDNDFVGIEDVRVLRLK